MDSPRSVNLMFGVPHPVTFNLIIPVKRHNFIMIF